ncbi:thioredoxin family protein [Flavivirga spongiicola]|uniref:Thioredoxin family protein n=1 Tax=Flavivirga spongiicola TaxID=421621 RepID=A0ABU7XUN8_9FLAO|nr:thioredoxin family protein [Flavivirga sp. MEBiC05379]MDO5979494.1 thioredoxin family protein [Flavivirga sp. MEBiC05379]
MKKIIIPLLMFVAICSNAQDGIKATVEKAFETAAKEDKKVVLYFTITGCVPCKVFEKAVMEKTSVMEKVNKDHILLKISADYPEGKDLCKKYKVGGFPFYIEMDEEKKILNKWVGWRSVDHFINTFLNGTEEQKAKNLKILGA